MYNVDPNQEPLLPIGYEQTREFAPQQPNPQKSTLSRIFSCVFRLFTCCFSRAVSSTPLQGVTIASGNPRDEAIVRVANETLELERAPQTKPPTEFEAMAKYYERNSSEPQFGEIVFRALSAIGEYYGEVSERELQKSSDGTLEKGLSNVIKELKKFGDVPWKEKAIKKAQEFVLRQKSVNKYEEKGLRDMSGLIPYTSDKRAGELEQLSIPVKMGPETIDPPYPKRDSLNPSLPRNVQKGVVPLAPDEGSNLESAAPEASPIRKRIIPEVKPGSQSLNLPRSTFLGIKLKEYTTNKIYQYIKAENIRTDMGKRLEQDRIIEQVIRDIGNSSHQVSYIELQSVVERIKGELRSIEDLSHRQEVTQGLLKLIEGLDRYLEAKRSGPPVE